MELDTSQATSKLMLTTLAAMATFERELMLERQREGIRKAVEAEKYRGRAPPPSGNRLPSRSFVRPASGLPRSLVVCRYPEHQFIGSSERRRQFNSADQVSCAKSVQGVSRPAEIGIPYVCSAPIVVVLTSGTVSPKRSFMGAEPSGWVGWKADQDSTRNQQSGWRILPHAPPGPA
jgi:hypothetical protein